MIIKDKKNKEEKIILPEKQSIGDKLELLKFMSEVQSRIKRDISSDFVLAKLGEKDKKAIIEMTSNAYFCKKLADLMTKQKKYEWQWDDKKNKGEWIRRSLNNKEVDTIIAYGNSIFDAFMTRIYMTTVLNRNVEKNYLINVLAGGAERAEQEKEEEESEREQTSLLGKIGKAIKGKKKKETEEEE